MYFNVGHIQHFSSSKPKSQWIKYTILFAKINFILCKWFWVILQRFLCTRPWDLYGMYYLQMCLVPSRSSLEPALCLLPLSRGSMSKCLAKHTWSLRGKQGRFMTATLVEAEQLTVLVQGPDYTLSAHLTLSDRTEPQIQLSKNSHCMDSYVNGMCTSSWILWDSISAHKLEQIWQNSSAYLILS